MKFGLNSKILQGVCEFMMEEYTLLTIFYYIAKLECQN